MKLSDLVSFKNQLDRLSLLNVKDNANADLLKMIDLIHTQESVLAGLIPAVDDNHRDLLVAFDQFYQTIDNIKKQVDYEIQFNESDWIRESYKIFDNEVSAPNDVDHILNSRQETIRENQEFFEKMRPRLQSYVNSKYPGLIIRPGRETFIDDFVGFDPLYIADISYGFLETAVSRYAEAYQRRIRQYVIDETDEDELIFRKFPDNQFGCVFAYNFYNFRPLEVIKRHLEEIYQKLKPGGVLVMTFNDCDRAAAVLLVEKFYACYTPGTYLRYMADTIGYEIIFSDNDSNATTWIELKKPGELDSIRGGIALAKIIPKSL
jgi:hypothetical protein